MFSGQMVKEFSHEYFDPVVIVGDILHDLDKVLKIMIFDLMAMAM